MSSESHDARPRATRGRTFLRWLVRSATAFLVLAILCLAALHSSQVATWLARVHVLPRALPSAASFSLDRADLSRVGRLVIEGLRIERADSRPVVAMRHAYVAIDVLPLLLGRVVVDSIDLSGGSVFVERSEDTTWRLFPSDASATRGSADSSSGSVSIDALTISDVSLEATISPDSVYRVENLSVEARDLRTGRDLSGRIATAEAELFWPGPDHPGGHLAIEGARWSTSLLELDTLHIEAGATVMSGGGVVGLEDTTSERTRFQLEADPLVYRDLRPLLPALGSGRMVAELEIEGAGRGFHTIRGQALTDADGVVEIDGRVRPAVDGRPFELVFSSELLGLDLSNVLDTSGLEGPLDARIEAELTGTAWSDVSGYVTLSSSGVPLGSTRVDRLDAETELDKGRGNFTVSAEGGGTELSGGGRLDLSSALPSYAGRIDFVFADSTVGSGSGHLEVEGEGVSSSARVRASVELDTARISGVVIDRADASVELVDGDVTGSFTVSSGAGAVVSEISGQPFQADPAWRLERGRFRGVQLRTLSPGAPESELNGRFSALLEPTPSEETRYRVALAIDSSTVGQATVEGGELNLTQRSGRAELEGELRSSDGSLTIDATFLPYAEIPRFDVRALSFEGVDLSAFVGDSVMSTELTGIVTAEGSGITPRSLETNTELRLQSSRINGATIERAGFRIAASRGRVRGEGEVDLVSGSVEFEGDVTIDSVPEYTAQVSLDLPRLNALLGDSLPASAVADLAVEGRGWTRNELDVSARLEIAELGWRDVEADSGRVTVTTVGGSLEFDTLWIDSNTLLVEGGGGIPFDPVRAGPDTADFAAVVTLVASEPVQAALRGPELSAGDGRAHISVRGAVDELRVSSDVALEALLLEDTRLIGLSGDALATYTPTEGWTSAEGTVLLDRLTLPTASVTRTEGAWMWAGPGSDIAIRTEAILDARRDLELEARLDPLAERPVLRVEAAGFRVDEDRWTLPEPALIRYGRGFEIEGFAMEANDQLVAIDAVLGEQHLERLDVRIESFRVETLADLIGLERLEGVLSTDIDLTRGTAGLEGTTSLDFDIRSPQGGGGRLSVDGAVTGERITLEGVASQEEAPRLRVSGTAPLSADTAASLDLEIQSDSFDVSFFTPLLDPDLVRGLRGYLDSDLQLAGTLGTPRPTGRIAAEGIRVHLPRLGVTYEVEGDLDLTGSTARVGNRLVARGGDGSLDVTGGVVFEGLGVGRYELQGRLDGFLVSNNDVAHAVVSGDLGLEGTLLAPTLSGTVTLDEGDLYLGGGLGANSVDDVVLTDADYDELEDYFGFPMRRLREAERAPIFEASTIDLSVRATRDNWLRQSANPELEVQVTGELRVEKEPGPDIRLVGEMEAIPARSYVEQFGRRFSLRQGQLVFRGGPLDTRLDLEASYEVPSRRDDEPEATIILGMEGEVEDLRVLLSSEPSMDNSDIVSYIATGRPASGSFDVGESGGVLSRGGDLALDQMTGLLEGLAAEQVGLDVVEIRRQGLDAATLVAGRYVSPTLYLGFQQPLGVERSQQDGPGREQTQIEVEVQAYRWLLLNFQSGGDALQFFLRSRYGY